ncbi:hypothetical protein [Stutzerimonas chloritidismutans]|uniref:hypothetical protein n=1 Tax=Stutzerimonas chloritidismutans TaxID=203192 RepID=UPI0028ACCF15|nr:hypothetical protein [Stutzerimonas chloritidismutans]
MQGAQLLSKWSLGLYSITWFLVVFGWIIVNWQNNRREDRKEIRNSITAITTEIMVLESLAAKYHTGKQRSIKKENRITYSISRISDHIRHLGFLERVFDEDIGNLRSSITLNNFQTSDFQSQEIGSELVENIRDYCQVLANKLENEFAKKYKGILPDRIKYSLEAANEAYPIYGFILFNISLYSLHGQTEYADRLVATFLMATYHATPVTL